MITFWTVRLQNVLSPTNCANVWGVLLFPKFQCKCVCSTTASCMSRLECNKKRFSLYYKLIKTCSYFSMIDHHSCVVYVVMYSPRDNLWLLDTANKSMCRSLSIWLSMYLSYRYALDLWGVFPGVTYRYETFTQCWFIVGPTSQTVSQL